MNLAKINFSNPQNQIIETKSGKKYKKADLKTNLFAFGCGLAVVHGTPTIQKYAGVIFKEYISEKGHHANKKFFNNSVLRAYDYTELYKENVRFIDAEKHDFENLNIKLPKWKKSIPLYQKYKNFDIKFMLNNCKRALTAVYNPMGKLIFVNFQKGGYMAFHEMGHALIANRTKIGKFLRIGQDYQYPIFLAMLAVSMLKRPKAKDEAPEGVIDKTTTFLKKYATDITLASRIPLLAEEALASIKGQNLAKNFVEPHEYKQIVKNNTYAWMLYLLSALCTTFVVYAAGKIKDKITAPQEIIDDKSPSRP